MPYVEGESFRARLDREKQPTSATTVSNVGGTRVTQTGLSLDTPQHLSPEQATGDRGGSYYPVDHSSSS
jgi:hypothetical protein